MSNDDMQAKRDDSPGQMQEACHIWAHPKFHVADVCKITGTTPKALEHFVNPKRNMVRLIGPHVNPGTGRRRIFSGGQVLMIAAAYAMTRIGFPQRWVRTLADEVERRANFRSVPGGTFETNMVLVTYPMNSGEDWAITRIFDQRAEEPILPVAFHALQVDRLIDEVKAQLEALVNDEEMPDFTVPAPDLAPNHYSPASNLFLAWEKSASGRWIYVGLTEDETDELLEIEGNAIQGDDLIDVGDVRQGGERYLELRDRHERERMKRCGMDLEGDDG